MVNLLWSVGVLLAAISTLDDVELLVLQLLKLKSTGRVSAEE